MTTTSHPTNGIWRASNLIPCHTLHMLAQTDAAQFRAKLAALSDNDLRTQSTLYSLYAAIACGREIGAEETLEHFQLSVEVHRATQHDTYPDAGAAIARQYHRDRARFLNVLRSLDRDAWCVLAEAYAAYLSRFGTWIRPEHVIKVWAMAVDETVDLPKNAA